MINIDYPKVKKAKAVLRALDHKQRQQIIKLLQDNGKLTVTELYISLRVEQSQCSQFLAILRKAGITNTVRDGKQIYYSLNTEYISEINTFVNQLIK